MRRDHKSTGWQQLPPIPRNAPGQAPAQRPTSQLVNRLEDEKYQEDTIYHMFECGRVTAEMVRPHVSHGTGWGGYVDATCLRIAALARQIQIKLKYPHVPFASPVRVWYAHVCVARWVCSPAYCLKDRASCRHRWPPDAANMRAKLTSRKHAC